MVDLDDVKDGGFKFERFKIYCKYICGEEVLKIFVSKLYILYWFMCWGCFNIFSKYFM